MKNNIFSNGILINIFHLIESFGNIIYARCFKKKYNTIDEDIFKKFSFAKSRRVLIQYTSVMHVKIKWIKF